MTIKTFTVAVLTLGMAVGSMTAASAEGCSGDHTTAKKYQSAPTSS